MPRGKVWKVQGWGCFERVEANGWAMMNALMCTWLFRVGVAILQRSIRLYAPFYSSDILIASPLGLRTIIGAEGEKKRDFDFLSSVELLIIDQADIYLMQNWEHVLVMLVIHVERDNGLSPIGLFKSRLKLDVKQGKVHLFQFENGKFVPSTHRLVRKLSEKIKVLVNIVKSPEKISSPKSSLLIDHFSVDSWMSR